MSNSAKTVLFFGDSITHAHRMPGEVHDCYQLGSGYANSAAAELSAADPGAGWRFVNRGECGDQISNLLRRCDADCLSFSPEIVSILIGVNDAGAGTEPHLFRETYQHLLDRIHTARPATRLVLLEPFGIGVEPQPPLDTISRRQLDQLKKLQPIVAELASAAGAVFVPLQHRFDEGPRVGPGSVWALDGIHPSAAGHWTIARAWTAAVREAGWFPAALSA